MNDAINKGIRSFMVLILISLLILIPTSKAYGADSYPIMPTYDVEYTGDYPYPFKNYIIIYDSYDKVFGYGTSEGYSEHWQIIGWNTDSTITISGTLIDVGVITFSEKTQMYIISCAYGADGTIWTAGSGVPNDTKLDYSSGNPRALYKAGQSIKDSSGNLIYDATDYSSIDMGIKITSPNNNAILYKSGVTFNIQATIPHGMKIEDYDLQYIDVAKESSGSLDTSMDLGIESTKQYFNDGDVDIVTWEYTVSRMTIPSVVDLKVKLSRKQADYYAYRTVTLKGINSITISTNFNREQEEAEADGTLSFLVEWQTNTKTVDGKAIDLKTGYRVVLKDSLGILAGYKNVTSYRHDGTTRNSREVFNVSFNSTGTDKIIAELQYKKTSTLSELLDKSEWVTICTSEPISVTINNASIDTDGDGKDDNTGVDMPTDGTYDGNVNDDGYTTDNNYDYNLEGSLDMLHDGWNLIKDSCSEMQGIVGVIFGFLPQPVVYLLIMLFTITICATIVKIIRG